MSLPPPQRVHRPEVYDDVDAGAAGRLHPGIQTGVPVAVLALLWQCLHHVPLPRAGEAIERHAAVICAWFSLWFLLLSYNTSLPCVRRSSVSSSSALRSPSTSFV